MIVRNQAIMLKTIKMLLALIPIVVLLIGACSKESYSAMCILNENNAILSIELDPMHPFFAEYNRFLILSIKGREPIRQKLFPDTGGYTLANLYKCSSKEYILKGYFDTWIIDLDNGAILKGQCQTNRTQYIGVFDGGGSKPWKFYFSSERKEKTGAKRCVVC